MPLIKDLDVDYNLNTLPTLETWKCTKYQSTYRSK